MSREQAGEWVASGDGARRRYPCNWVAAIADDDGGYVAWSPPSVSGAKRLAVGHVKSSDGNHRAAAMATCDVALRAAGHLPPLRKAGRPPTRGAAATRAVRVRLTPDEHAAVLAAASARGESLSEYVRGRVL